MLGRSKIGALAVLGGLLLVPASSLPAGAHHHASSPIQPGAEISYPGVCSFNFVFEDTQGALYIGTAGHCVSRKGQYVIPAEFDQAIGQVAWIAEGPDFALVEVEPSLYDRVDPAVRHWGGPTGMASLNDTQTGDRVQHYGHGAYYRESEATRPRTGVLVTHTNQTYCAEEPVYGGDSGSAVLTGDGLALGIATQIGVGCLPPTALQGPTVSHVLASARQAGLNLSVVTAPLADPVEREQARIAHL